MIKARQAGRGELDCVIKQPSVRPRTVQTGIRWVSSLARRSKLNYLAFVNLDAKAGALNVF
jgi:hypothetical protein